MPNPLSMYAVDAVAAIAEVRGWSACRAAMLRGAEHVSNRDELPLGYLQGHKDGLEWAAQLAEANHPQTGDWLYDDPLELAKAIRKGPDMPEFDGPTPVTPDMTTGWQELTEQEYEFVKDNASENAEFRTVYTAPPATVVPDERAAFNAWNNDENLPIAGVGAKNAAWLAWQARAELGRSLAVNSPVTPDGWISCSERMPEIRQTVIGWNGYAVRQCVYTRNGYAKTQKGREPRFETLTGIWHGVTHWMPLPEPPQEVK
ncbi:DUF551 domain-containing protein [Escherichia coli]|uniref:DUF551 domain-containing protein n=2 Tax=Escherichia coli TaxID=562 RepID=UPI0028683A14|nr:DUF551 domain-containing protein [Escherichia coli]